VVPGTYTYAFALPLPADLPASFGFRGQHHMHPRHPVKAKTAYYLKAKVCMHSQHLHSYQDLVLGDRVETSVGSVVKENRKSFLLNKGNLYLRAELNKEVFFPGEQALIKLVVMNESVKEVRGVNVKLHQHIHLRAEQHTYITSRIAHSLNELGVREATKDTRLLKFTLPYDSHAPLLTVDSPLIRSHFELQVECDVPMAFDLELRFPVVLTTPQYLQSVQRPPDLEEDAQLSARAERGESYHETTPLLLPEGTGECKCCILF